MPKLANPADVVAWNTDKRYLVSWPRPGYRSSTPWVEPVTRGHRRPREWVVKPAVSSGSKDSGRYDLANPAHRDLAVAHVARLQAAAGWSWCSRTCRRWTPTARPRCCYLGGDYSHSIRKGPLLTGPDLGDVELYKAEKITSRLPTPAEL